MQIARCSVHNASFSIFGGAISKAAQVSVSNPNNRTRSFSDNTLRSQISPSQRPMRDATAERWAAVSGVMTYAALRFAAFFAGRATFRFAATRRAAAGFGEG